jgi:hypothetical protein
MKKKKKNYFILVIMIWAFAASAQHTVTKASFFPESRYKMFGIAQEFTLSKRVSLQATFKFMPLSSIPEAKYAARAFTDPVTGNNPFNNTKANALGSVIEVRVYSKKKAALRGFYWGLFISASSYSLSTGVFSASYKFAPNYIYTLDMLGTCKINAAGGGLQMGLQTIIKNKLSLDWTILGIGVCQATVLTKIKAVNAPAEFNLSALPNNKMSSDFAFEKYFPLRKTIDAQSIEMAGKGLLPMVRTSISIGIGY